MDRRRPRRGAAPDNGNARESEEIVTEPALTDTHQRLFTAWRYKVARHDEATMFSPEPLTLDQALALLEARWPGLVEYLKPAGDPAEAVGE